MPCHGDFERYESCSQALRGCSRSLRVFHNLLVSGADEDDILEHLKSMKSSMTIVEDETASAASTMKCPLAEKQDFKGRTILVNAIRGNYPRVVEQLLVCYHQGLGIFMQQRFYSKFFLVCNIL